MASLYKQFLALIPPRVRVVGDVTSIDDGLATITLPSGAITRARGETTIGARVFVRDGVIEGPAPALPIEILEV